MLVVDDRSSDLVQYASWLALAGASVEGARTVEQARALLDEQPFDIVVIDRLLPDGDGFLELVRLNGPEVLRAHVILSGHFPVDVYEAIDQTSAVPAGKDGLVAPWVLVSVVHEACRRVGLTLPQFHAPGWIPAPGASPLNAAPWVAPWELVDDSTGPSREVLVVAPVSLDLVGRTATVFGRPVTLRGKEFGVLACLMRNRGRPVSQGELLAEVWGQQHNPGNAIVRNQVARLRRALGLGTAFVQTAGGGQGWGVALARVGEPSDPRVATPDELPTGSRET